MDADPPDREFFTVASESGRLTFLIFYGLVGSATTVALVDGWWIPMVLACGALVGGLMAWRMYGYSHLWMEGTSLVEKTPVKEVHMPFSKMAEVTFSYAPFQEIHFSSTDGDVIVVRCDERTLELRQELGRRLRAERGHAHRAAQRSRAVMQALGLPSTIR